MSVQSLKRRLQKPRVAYGKIDGLDVQVKIEFAFMFDHFLFPWWIDEQWYLKITSNGQTSSDSDWRSKIVRRFEALKSQYGLTEAS